MLSGNGRHRRPRQAPALLVAAGVTGSAIAIPLLGAGSASAADGATWDRVAECESGGSWSQNTGNGYYGGLQLTQDAWEAYGGLDYAQSADQASRGQQIAVAERILADQGVGAWRTCGLLAGLDQDSASVDIDTGVAEDSTSDTSGSPDSGDSSASSAPSPTSDPSSTADDAEGAESPKSPESTTDASAGADASADSGADTGASPSASATPKADESDKAGQSDGSSGLTDTEGTSAGRHRGGSADEGRAEDRTSESSGRHASRGTDASRDAADGSYTVRTGDSLSSIADSLELGGGWRALYAENEQVVGADPNLILPGQELAVGVEPGEK
ncbi:transglycosylase family protein [Streptomyces griseoloalbus]|uniref:Transglycosylase family protein n=1 Tax=Streptomyces griseoloalbus TaxID=67303 RepID=A0ABV3EC54_9ACTN